MNEIVRLLSRLQETEGVRILVIGGRGLEAHGIQRFTRDFDVLIGEGDMVTLPRFLIRAGFEPLGENASFARFRHESLLYEPVDVMKVSTPTMNTLWEDSVLLPSHEATLRAPTAKSMTALKLHALKQDPSRLSRDLPDIIALLQCSAATLSWDDFLALAARYGPAGIAEKVRQLLQP